ncbi:MAG TPA: hypothetical protein GXX16_04565 [Epulopiscium sp.]|nr:hypothetical protein [Candidatus Epulonipiscium sp.]
MSCFLKRRDQSLILVDYNIRNGLYYQIFRKDQPSRPNLLLSNGTHEYTAFLDEKNNFHVIAKNTRNQIIHFKETSTKITKEILLDDPNNTFNIDNIYAISVRNQIHLFYYADHPYTKTPELIYHLVNEPLITPRPIATLYSRNINYDCMRSNSELYLAVIMKNDDSYNIEIKRFKNFKDLTFETFTPVSSQFPIIYCKICIDQNEIMHLVYVQEQYGKYQLIHKSYHHEWSDEKILYSCGYPIKPVIFIYNDALWINWNENGNIYAILSADHGSSFSKSIHASIDDPDVSLHSYDADQDASYPLICNQLYGVTYPVPKFAVLHSLDMDGIHINMTPNTELKLYLNTIKNAINHSVSKSKLEEENENLKNEIIELTQVQRDITNQYNELADLAKRIQDEGKKWRELYFKGKTEIDFYKKRVKQLEKSLSSNNQNTSIPESESQEESTVTESEGNSGEASDISGEE